MATVRLRLKSGNQSIAFKDLVGRITDLQPALEEIGVMLTGNIRRAFKDGGRGQKWPETQQPNIAALAKAISEGKGPKTRDLGGSKKPLVDSGRLRDSITYRTTKNSVIVGTGLPYALLHQQGGTSKVPNKIPQLIEQGNKRAEGHLKKIAKKFPKAAARLKRENPITIKVRRRPFLTIEPEDVKMIRQILSNHINGKS